MASGFKTYSASVQVDLDDIFATRSTTARANTGFLVGSQDLADRYEKSGGGDLIGYNTYFKSGSTDLGSIFRDKNYSAATPTPTPTSTATPTPTPTSTATPTPTPSPTPSLITVVSWSPASGQTKYPNDNISVQVIPANGNPANQYQWYDWDGSTYVAASGQTTSTYNLGTYVGGLAGTPDENTPGIFTYYYCARVHNVVGWNGNPDLGDANLFEWQVSIDTN